MELKYIFKMQEKLDQAIKKKHNVALEDTIDKKYLALLVEIAEFANEIQSFKYWKNNTKIDNEKMQEEFVDGIHFFISLFSDYKITQTKYYVSNEKLDLNQAFLELYTLLCIFWKNKKNTNILIESLELYLRIALNLGMSYKDIEKKYVVKNNKNFKRIENNY